MIKVESLLFPLDSLALDEYTLTSYIQRQITLKFVKSLCWKNCQNKKVQAKKPDIPGYLWYFKKVYISESNEIDQEWEK